MTLEHPRFCSQCGTPLNGQTAVCSHCNAELDERFPGVATPVLEKMPIEKTARAQNATARLLETFKGPQSRRTLFKGVLAASGVAVVGAGALYAPIFAMAKTRGKQAQTAKTLKTSGSAQDTIVSILTVARTAEQLAVTFYSNGTSLLTLLHKQFVAGYYQRQATQYHALLTQVPAVITNATGQLQGQAQRDMQSFQTELINVNAQGIGNLQMFAQSLSQEQLQFAAARLPQDYFALSQDARTSIQSLDLLTTTFHQLNDFSAILNKMKQAHQDTTLLQTMYQNDLQLFNSAAQASDFQNLGADGR